jgi:hypothetical protein
MSGPSPDDRVQKATTISSAATTSPRTMAQPLDEDLLRAQIGILRDARADAARGDVEAQRAASAHVPGNLYQQVRESLAQRRQLRPLTREILALEDVAVGVGNVPNHVFLQRLLAVHRTIQGLTKANLVRAALTLQKARAVRNRLEAMQLEPDQPHTRLPSSESMRIQDGRRGYRHPSQATRASLVRYLQQRLEPWT